MPNTWLYSQDEEEEPWSPGPCLNAKYLALFTIVF